MEQTKAMKACPFCGEDILIVAVKCKHCGSMISQSTPETTSSGTSTTPPPPLPQDTAQIDTQVKQLINSGEKIEAIKFYREKTGVGLKEAKDYVEGLEKLRERHHQGPLATSTVKNNEPHASNPNDGLWAVVKNEGIKWFNGLSQIEKMGVIIAPIFVLLVLAAVVSGIRGCNDAVTDTLQQVSTEMKQEAAEAAKLYKVGETVSYKDSDWVVVSAQTLGSELKSGNAFVDPARTEGAFVYVKFTVKNTTKSEQRILVFTPLLVDAEGREFREYDNEAPYFGEGEERMIIQSLPASLIKKFSAIYEVPKEAKGLKFRTRSLTDRDKTRMVDLGL